MKYLKIYINTDLKIILFDHQNNCRKLKHDKQYYEESFDILVTNLSVPYNYFNNPIKLFSDPYLKI